MASKKKYYVVWQGHETGIFDNWTTCQKQIKNYPGAKYKAFPNLEEAQQAWNSNYFDYIGNKPKKPTKPTTSRNQQAINYDSWSVDAACSGNPGIMEYRGVDTKTGIELFKMGPYRDGTNNIGEFLAIVHALALLKKKGDQTTAIYTDSRTALAWVRNKKAKTTLKETRYNTQLFELISRAEAWLKSNSWPNKLIKWNTEEWGEIPADFGRK